MRLFIPPLGTELTLDEDWTFKLHNEHRNLSLIKAIEPVDEPREFWKRVRSVYPRDVTLPGGTVLIVDRIYIKKNAVVFDSVTFRIKSSPMTELAKKRFWAKLTDVNAMLVQ